MVKVLADTVQRAADLDEASAQEAVKAAEKALNEKGADFDYSSAAASSGRGRSSAAHRPADPQKLAAKPSRLMRD